MAVRQHCSMGGQLDRHLPCLLFGVARHIFEWEDKDGIEADENGSRETYKGEKKKKAIYCLF